MYAPDIEYHIAVSVMKQHIVTRRPNNKKYFTFDDMLYLTFNNMIYLIK